MPQVAPAPPAIAILDYRLDGAERGDGVFAALCEAWGCRPPAILLTDEASAETEIAAARMGTNRLLKPCPPAAMRALIATCLTQARREGDTSQMRAESATG